LRIFKALIRTMSVKKKETLQARRQFIVEEVRKRTHEKLEYVVNDLADRLFLSVRTIYRDLENYREDTTK